MYLLKTGQRFGFLLVQSLFLIHVKNAHLVPARWKAAFCVRSACDLKKEPITVAFRVRVWSQIEVVLSGLYLYRQVKIT